MRLDRGGASCDRLNSWDIVFIGRAGLSQQRWVLGWRVRRRRQTPRRIDPRRASAATEGPPPFRRSRLVALRPP